MELGQGRPDLMHWQSRGRDSHQKDGDQPRAGRAVAHLKHAGNSGVFLGDSDSIKNLEAGKDGCPRALRCRCWTSVMRPTGKRPRQAERLVHKPVMCFTGNARMKAFTPQITYKKKDGTEYVVGKPNSSRSFHQRLTQPAGQWNHYYIRAINGEVRLWVNGVEVSGGTECKPATDTFVSRARELQLSSKS